MEEFRCIRIEHDLQNMRSFGPTAEIDIAFPDQESPIARQQNVRALIDTGAGRSVLSNRLVTRIGAKPNTQVVVTSEDGETKNVSAFRCVLFYPNGIEQQTDCAVWERRLETHDILIGRDLLLNTRLVVDFKTGRWELCFWRT